MSETWTAYAQGWQAQAGAYLWDVQGFRLRLLYNDTVCADLNLGPIINSHTWAWQPWVFTGDELISRASDGDYTLRLRARQGDITYRLYGPAGDVSDLVFCHDSVVDSLYPYTFIPDAHNGPHSRQAAVSVRSAAAVDLPAQLGMDLPQSHFLTPAPRACAWLLSGVPEAQGWLSLSMPGPHALEYTDFNFQAARFNIRMRNLRVAEDGIYPFVCLTPGLADADAALHQHRVHAARLALTRADKPYFAWWHAPVVVVDDRRWTKDEGEERQAEGLTAAGVRRWVKVLEQRAGNTRFSVTLAGNWFTAQGDYLPHPERFGGFEGMRMLIDELHAGGHKVLLSLSPLRVDRESDYFRTCARGLVHTKQGDALPLRDLTATCARDHLERVVIGCLSNGPLGLDADGFRLDGFHEWPRVSLHKLSNPAWGSGDRMAWEFVHWLYLRVHGIKQDALIAASAAEPYMQPYVDRVCLNENLLGRSEPWLGRARVARLAMPNTLLESDGGLMTRALAAEYWMLALAFSVPSLLHAGHFDGGEPFAARDWRRLAASWAVYELAPTHPYQEVIWHPPGAVVGRRYPAGELSGDWAALALSHRCLATFAPGVARVTATQSENILLPLPAGVTTVSAERVGHDGSRHAVPAPYVQAGKQTLVVLSVPDAASETRYVEVKYSR